MKARNSHARNALKAWLALASLIPAQNLAEKISKSDDTPKKVDEAIQKAKLENLKLPELPEPDPNTTVAEPAIPEVPAATPPPANKAKKDLPALPVPKAPPANAPLPAIPDSSGGFAPLPTAPAGPTTPSAPAIPGELPGDALAIPGGTPADPLTPDGLPADGTNPLGTLPTAGDPATPPGGGLTPPADGAEAAEEGVEDEEDSQRPGGLFGSGNDGPLGGAPNEVSDLLDKDDFGFEEKRKQEGFGLNINITEAYSTNLEIREDNPSATVFTTVSPTLTFQSAADGTAINIIKFDYGADFNFYHSGEQEDNINHSAEFIYSHTGSRAFVELGATYTQENSSNRLTETFSETTGFSTSVDFSYVIGASTSLYANAEYFERSNNVSSSGDSSLFTAAVSALWQSTATINLGPSLRYAYNDSDSIGTSESTALTLEARYRPNKRTAITINAGVEASSFEDGDTEYAPASSIRISYAPSPIWKFTGDLRYESIPVSEINSQTFGSSVLGGSAFSELNGAGADGGQQINGSLGVVYRPDEEWRLTATFTYRTAPSFINVDESLIDTTINLGASRRIGGGMASARYSYSLTEFESGSGPDREDQQFQLVSLDYSHPDIYKGITFRGGIAYSQSSGGREFDQTLASVSFGYQF